MVGVGRFSQGAAAIAALSALVILPARAQEGGVETVFGLGQRIEANDNLDLDTDSAGTTTLATTSLSFGLTSATPLDTLELTASTAFRVENGPNASGTETYFDDTRLGFGYAREGATALFEVSAYLRESRVEFLRPLEDFLNDDGAIDLPEDAAELEGDGTRLSYGMNSTLELGAGGPAGLILDAGFRQLDYVDVSDPDLTDNRRAQLSATARLSFSPVTEGRFGLSYSTYEDDDAAETQRETSAATAAFVWELSPASTLEAGLGYTVVDTEEFGDTAREEGATARLALTRELPNGTLSGDIATEVTENGTRYRLGIGREMELPAGALAARVGLTALEGDSPEVTAALSWQQELPTGTLSAELSRDVRLNSNDDEQLATALALGYSYQINAVSGLNFGLRYASTDEAGPDNRIDNAAFTASYSHRLTEDWDLSAGYTYRHKDRESTGEASSNTVFLGLSREFGARR